ncbi:hypothetical protein Tco_0923809 [Tanacetum coccineum]|uniref:Reverse transcriptase domain-containing protein n=1 Tax=Tanacetum coccineum TaxID=301880 RepID=A0ABQ5D223_9ASTR
MKISGFMYGITNLELIKRLHDKIPKLVDEMMREAGRKQNFDRRGDFRNQQRSERRRDKFTLLTKSPKEILALDKGKFKTPPPMTTPIEKRNNNKFCEFHEEVGHNTDECMHLKRQIEELIKAGKLSHPWQRVARQKITQSFSPDLEISFPPLRDEDGAEGPMIIEAEIGVPGGILTLRSSKIVPLECTMISGPEAQLFAITQATEKRIKVSIHSEYPEQTIAVGSTLTEYGRKALFGLLRRNLDIFAWKPEDMTRVPQHLAEHRLNVREGCPPVRQKKRSQEPERNKAIQEEVEKLVDAGIMKEVHYHSWL